MTVMNTTLRIGGSLSDPDVARRLILAIVESDLLPAGYDEIFSEFRMFREPSDVLDYVAACDGALGLVGEQLQGLREIVSFCRREELPYERVTGLAGEAVTSTWLPNFEREVPSSRVGGEIVIPMTLLSAALRGGIGAVTELHDTYRILREFEVRLVVGDGILERLKAIPEDGWGQDVTMQATPSRLERGPAP